MILYEQHNIQGLQCLICVGLVTYINIQPCAQGDLGTGDVFKDKVMSSHQE